MKKLLLLFVMTTVVHTAFCQTLFTLQECINYAVENNCVLQKNKLDREKTIAAQREVLGALLPQVSASGGVTYNIQKTTFAMPNFVNSMMPAAMQDPNAAKYMTISMGMNYSANAGISLVQQALNFSLFNALNITKATQGIAETGVEISTNDVIAQTVTFYYNVQVLNYAIQQFNQSLGLMDKTLALLQINKDNDLVRQLDVNRVMVTKTNMKTQKSGLQQAMQVQENLLKLQMGFQMNDTINIEIIDIAKMEEQVNNLNQRSFDVSTLSPYQLLKQQQGLLKLQQKSAKYETLPTLTFAANYSQNYMCDKFFTGETLYNYPVSMMSFNLKVPLFAGMSKYYKIRQTEIELSKSNYDEQQLAQVLTMSHNNAAMQLEQNRVTIQAQKQNKQLAEDVFTVTQSNFVEGISSLSDVLNASSSAIQAQVNYVEALNNYMKAYIDLKKADGTIKDFVH